MKNIIKKYPLTIISYCLLFIGWVMIWCDINRIIGLLLSTIPMLFLIINIHLIKNSNLK